jgi:hypothetical protein
VTKSLFEFVVYEYSGNNLINRGSMNIEHRCVLLPLSFFLCSVRGVTGAQKVTRYPQIKNAVLPSPFDATPLCRRELQNSAEHNGFHSEEIRVGTGATRSVFCQAETMRLELHMGGSQMILDDGWDWRVSHTLSSLFSCSTRSTMDAAFSGSTMNYDVYILTNVDLHRVHTIVIFMNEIM